MFEQILASSQNDIENFAKAILRDKTNVINFCINPGLSTKCYLCDKLAFFINPQLCFGCLISLSKKKCDCYFIKNVIFCLDHSYVRKYGENFVIRTCDSVPPVKSYIIPVKDVKDFTNYAFRRRVIDKILYLDIIRDIKIIIGKYLTLIHKLDKIFCSA